MSILTSPRFQAALPPEPIAVADYHRLIRSGILTEDDKVELLEGRIVPKMARTPPHDVSIHLTQESWQAHLPPGWCLRVQMAITLADSEPEPDLTLARGSARRYSTQHPGPADVGTLAEVANTSLSDDREKGRIYARADIPIYWIINVEDRQVEVYTDPAPHALPPHYRQRQDYPVGQSVPLVLEGQTVALLPVAELLP